MCDAEMSQVFLVKLTASSSVGLCNVSPFWLHVCMQGRDGDDRDVCMKPNLVSVGLCCGTYVERLSIC